MLVQYVQRLIDAELQTYRDTLVWTEIVFKLALLEEQYCTEGNGWSDELAWTSLQIYKLYII